MKASGISTVTWKGFVIVILPLIVSAHTLPVVVSWTLVKTHAGQEKHKGAPSVREFKRLEEQTSRIESKIDELIQFMLMQQSNAKSKKKKK